MEIKSVAKQNCRIRVAVGVRARAPRGKILGERQGGIPSGGAGVCFGGRAALILRYSRPASSFVSLRTGVQCSVANQRGGDGTRALMTVSAPASNSANCHCFR